MYVYICLPRREAKAACSLRDISSCILRTEAVREIYALVTMLVGKGHHL